LLAQAQSKCLLLFFCTKNVEFQVSSVDDNEKERRLREKALQSLKRKSAKKESSDDSSSDD
jgi:hypothetical protein